MLGGDNFTVRGISFIGRHTAGNTDDPSIYCVALVNQATNARVQGCWFGLAPGGSTQADLKPAAAAVAGFRYRDGGDVYSEGLIVGTDGDGVNDRAEFNVILGCRIGLALELPGARIAGNYFNVFPDGLHFVDVDAVAETIIAQGPDAGEHVENIENGRVTDGTVIGTNGDGVSDSDERNIFAHASYDHDVEFYSSAKNAVIAGNYFGVGVDGVTVGPIPALSTPDLAELPGNGSVRLGSNGDGVSDALEGNLIHSVPGSRLVIAGSGVPIVARRNKMVNNNTRAVPFADGENAVYASYYAPFLADVSAGVAPVLQSLSGGILTGTLPAPSAGYPNAVIDLYRVDPAALAKTNFWPAALVHPLTWLGSYSDNGPGDLDPDPNKFSINVNAFGLSDTTYLAAAASYSTDPALFNGTNAVTSPMSNPISARPSIAISLQLPTGVELSWLGPDGAYKAQINNNVGDTGGWAPVGPSTYTGGRNVIITGFDPFPETIVFYRLINQ